MGWCEVGLSTSVMSFARIGSFDPSLDANQPHASGAADIRSEARAEAICSRL